MTIVRTKSGHYYDNGNRVKLSELASSDLRTLRFEDLNTGEDITPLIHARLEYIRSAQRQYVKAG